MDFWLRYLEPVAYRKLNAPLPVEWETEVFEKFEAPYRRSGAGLTLLQLYLDEGGTDTEQMIAWIREALDSSTVFRSDSLVRVLQNHHHFFLANRLFLLNLAAIYTTGFDCPVPADVIPELRVMVHAVDGIYRQFEKQFPEFRLPADYHILYARMIDFLAQQPEGKEAFDHFVFIRSYINPLFSINQELIRSYRVISNSYNDYSLSDRAPSVFDKALYEGQETKGVYKSIQNDSILREIRTMGRMLFNDPILSGNNQRSCASCHRPDQYFTDTSRRTALHFDRVQSLRRNAPSLVNVAHNHLLMMDGRQIGLVAQMREVLSNPDEMDSSPNEAFEKVLSCPDYRKNLEKWARMTGSKKPEFEHMAWAIILYLGDFGAFAAPFDEAMNGKAELSQEAKNGFNLFMGKAACATCHFVPLFNGVKPPYIGSEFEVIGVPQEADRKALSRDSGRYSIHPAPEMLHAFRTGTIRNSSFTAPYMHNGVFRNLTDVVRFYDEGGGAGSAYPVDNQTLSRDSLHLSDLEKLNLIRFMESLDEKIIFEGQPAKLPESKNKTWNNRKVGGEY